jgi:predicted Zn-dependent protease with MMP-like domain
VIEIPPARFAEMVGDALDTLPPWVTKAMRNVEVTVDDGDDPHLLGLYQGVPLTERSSNYSTMMPDKVTIFRLAICARADDEDEVIAQVRATVVHEIGHHFGIDDARLRELGW